MFQITCYTFHKLHIAIYMSHISCHILYATYCMLHMMVYNLYVAYYILQPECHMLRVTFLQFKMLTITCYMLHITVKS